MYSTACIHVFDFYEATASIIQLVTLLYAADRNISIPIGHRVDMRL